MSVATICNKINRENPTVVERLEDRTADLTLQHEANPPGRSVINNRGFAWVGAIMVEVVRRGPNHTRVRRNLHANGATYLVNTADLLGYTYVS